MGVGPSYVGGSGGSDLERRARAAGGDRSLRAFIGLREHRLLIDERGSSTVEAVAAIGLITLLVVGGIQVALSLYARNVIVSSAHEGARAAVEYGRDPADARSIVRSVIQSGAGSAVSAIQVSPVITHTETETIADVVVRAIIEPLGPIPIEIPVTARATAGRPRVE